MVKVVAMVALALMALAQGAWAQDSGAPAAADPLAEAIARNPERVEAQLVDLVAGFGGADGLKLAGIEDHIALERARARASALRRVLAMDLDADGAVTRAELAVAQRASAAPTRGRMERQFAAADADADDRLDPQEIAADAQGAALRALGEDEAALLRSVLRLDADGDGAVTVAEVQRAVKRLDEAT